MLPLLVRRHPFSSRNLVKLCAQRFARRHVRRSVSSSVTSERRDDTELLHQVEQRGDTPVLSDLAVDDPHGVDGIETDLLPCGRNTEELPWWVP